MDTIQFDRWTEELGKEQFRVLLSQYIANNETCVFLETNII